MGSPDSVGHPITEGGSLTSRRDRLGRGARAAGPAPPAGFGPGPDGETPGEGGLGRGCARERSWTRGAISLAEGELTRPRPTFDRRRRPTSATCSLPDLARVYEAAGKRDSALATYERYLATPWLFRYENDAVELGWTMKRLGELYEEQGDRDKAAATFSKLTRLWERADPELQPVLRRAH